MVSKTLLSIAALALVASASTTMCYKKAHSDPDTIETIALDGGECESKYSLKQMKHKGYRVDDIKISNAKEGMDYIYILKRPVAQKEATAHKQQAKHPKEQEKGILDALLEKEPKQSKAMMIEKGKKLYTSTCQRCHGKNADISAYNSSLPLIDLDFSQMEQAIEAYKLDQKNNGYAIVMAPYASSITGNQLEDIYEYIQTLK